MSMGESYYFLKIILDFFKRIFRFSGKLNRKDSFPWTLPRTAPVADVVWLRYVPHNERPHTGTVIN